MAFLYLLSNGSIAACIGDRLFFANRDATDAENESSIRTVDLSEYDHVLAVDLNRETNSLTICTSKKQVLVFNLENLSLTKTFTLNKQATSVKFCRKFKKLLIADRSGVITELDLSKDVVDSGSPIMGHVSMILDLIFSPDENYLITCDRDEKIRVSHFPNAYNIESYCLGHTQYVRKLSWLKCQGTDILVSGGGDGCANLWDHKSGHLVKSFDLTAKEYWIEKNQPSVVRIKKIAAIQTEFETYLVAIFEESSNFLCLKLLMDSPIAVDCTDARCVDVDSQILDFDVSNENAQILILRQSDLTPILLYEINVNGFIISQTSNRLIDNLNATDKLPTAFDRLPSLLTLPLMTKRKYNVVEEIKDADSSQSSEVKKAHR